MLKKIQSKKRGQVFLKDKNILEKILKLADIKKDQHVLEIGCGEGILTQPLSDKAGQLTVIEYDMNFLDYCKQHIHENCPITWIQGDFEKTKFSQVNSANFRIIANIPYQISTSVIQEIVRNRAIIKPSLLMVQEAFAKRLTAAPGTKIYGALSLYAQFYLDVTICFNVSRTCYFPIPNVDSCVITIKPKKQLPYDLNEELFFKIIKTAFWGRRKTLFNCLKKGPYLKVPESVFKGPFLLGKEKVRGEVLTMSDFYALYLDLCNLV